MSQSNTFNIDATDVAPVIKLAAQDDVGIARRDLAAGELIGLHGPVSAAPIPAGHKVALHGISKGATVRRYGQVIGMATQPISAGEHVHVHNLGMGEFSRSSSAGEAYRPTTFIDPSATFMGIVRADGRVATRNYIGILSTVNCSANVSHAIADRFKGVALADYPNVDGVVALTHGSGCAMDPDGEGLALLRRTLSGYARHANFAAVLIVGLGCESNQLDALKVAGDLSEGPMLHTLGIQSSGGTRAAIDAGVTVIEAMLPEANKSERQPVAAKHLIVGLQCGGSDGYSGISANPVLGAAVDLLVRHGGTAVLSETPEIYGAEHLLTARAALPAVAEKLEERLRWWEDYTSRNHGEMNNNPSPGNKVGGLTTILEKSLGAVAKGGSSGLMAVVEYAKPVQAQGLVFMDTPGYDPVSATGQVAGGANLICFTTGRGSVYGCKPSPSLKIATNSDLYRRMNEDMDFNAGEVLDGTTSVQDAGARLFELMLETASGGKTKSEALGIGTDEFVPWQLGAVM
jgi:altronate hydrolase